jgi:gluconolactonase
MQTKILASLSFITAISMGCAHQINTYPTTKISGLKTPESVLQAPDGKIYVSEINGWDKDGDGQITVIQNDKVRVFARGLDDPKGLAMVGGNLFVADKNKIVKIDPNGQTSIFAGPNSFPAAPIFFNDLEADLNGNLYVSDTGDVFNSGKGGAVYKVDILGKVTLVVNNVQDNRIKAPNGLLMDDTGDVISIVDFSTGILYSYNMKTKTLVDIANGFGGGDGLVHHSSGKMFVSDWNNGKVFSINMAGDVKEIKSGYKAAADIALTRDEKFIMVPDFKAGELDFIPVQ